MPNTIINLKELKKDQKKINKAFEKRRKRLELIEKICRELCTKEGIDPSILICKQMPQYINYPIPTFVCPNPQWTMPAWMLYRDVVEATLEALDK